MQKVQHPRPVRQRATLRGGVPVSDVEARVRLLKGRMSREQREQATQLEFAVRRLGERHTCTPEERLFIAERICAGLPIEPEAVMGACLGGREVEHELR
jgi:hypothetical protein